MPLTLPSIASLVIFQFLWVWNGLLVALISLLEGTPSAAPMTVTISSLVNSLGGNWQVLNGGRVHLDGAATASVLYAATLFRQRHPGRFGQWIEKEAANERFSYWQDMLNKLRRRDVRQLPVLREGKLTGLLRRQDIIRWLQLESEGV